METLLAFIWAPLVLYGLSVGLALLAERVLRLELPNALLAPVGLALLISLVMPVYRLGRSVGGWSWRSRCRARWSASSWPGRVACRRG